MSGSALGYLCATSIVKLETFDRHWPAGLRVRLKTSPTEWRQQGVDGRALKSWYGGDYEGACMNHPDWREYEKFMVRETLECGHDGIFFDNPTVHPEGCYCSHCMRRFAAMLESEGMRVADRSVEGMRRVAVANVAAFRRFRGTVAREFLAEMRAYARSVRRGALVTCNNSLNTPAAFYAQCRTHGYNIDEMSRVEDFVVVEDMQQQPRVLADGRTVEYGPTYRLLQAISHGKPVVAVTIADGDYHTPPHLVRLAMAEAAAHDASYLSWPTWPENERSRMASIIRPQADFLRGHERLLNGAKPRRDVVLFMPFRRWVETDRCIPGELSAALTTANVQFEVLAGEDFTLRRLKNPRPFAPPLLLVESRQVLNEKERGVVAQFEREGGRVMAADTAKTWLDDLRQREGVSARLAGPAAARMVVRDQSGRVIVHLYNLGVERLSSFQDKVVPLENLEVRCRVPFSGVKSVRLLTADAGGQPGEMSARWHGEGSMSEVTLKVPRLEISGLLVIEH